MKGKNINLAANAMDFLISRNLDFFYQVFGLNITFACHTVVEFIALAVELDFYAASVTRPYNSLLLRQTFVTGPLS
jgi:hypothetical protein